MFPSCKRPGQLGSIIVLVSSFCFDLVIGSTKQNIFTPREEEDLEPGCHPAMGRHCPDTGTVVSQNGNVAVAIPQPDLQLQRTDPGMSIPLSGEQMDPSEPYCHENCDENGDVCINHCCLDKCQKDIYHNNCYEDCSKRASIGMAEKKKSHANKNLERARDRYGRHHRRHHKHRMDSKRRNETISDIYSFLRQQLS